MGLLDIFDKDKRRQSNIERWTRKGQQKFGQSDIRTKALDQLRDDGSEAAIDGLLMRFVISVEPGITDREEKQWVHDVLCSFGETSMPSIKRFLERRDEVTWALKAASDIIGTKGVTQMVLELLNKMAEQYQREHTKKITLIKHLIVLGHGGDDVAETLMKFLDDMDRDSVIAAIEALTVLDEHGLSREPILERLKEDGEENMRLRKAVFEMFTKTGWDVKGYTPTVEALMIDPWYLTGDGIVKARTEAVSGGMKLPSELWGKS